jgi:hypothetical protein
VLDEERLAREGGGDRRPTLPRQTRRSEQHLVAAILSGERYNEAVRGAEASLATAMGRFKFEFRG